MRNRFVRHLLAGLAWAVVGFAGFAGSAAAANIPDFCFIQISDTHLSPWPEGAGDPFPRDRSTDCIAWVCEQVKQPQTLAPVNIKTPKPGFIAVTGDLVEFGAVGKTWSNIERSFASTDLPVYLLCGNHDNTWNSFLHHMKDRHGGDHYSFDKFGCHFSILDTATPQEPLPVIEQRTLTWLANDLEKVKKGTPIFLFCHHPIGPGSSEFSQPVEPLGLLETIRGHNVVLLLMGHGHGLMHEKLGWLDCAEGGSTFGPNTGYNIIAVKDGVLHVVYRFRDENKPMVEQLSKPLQAPPPAEIVWLSPEPNAELGDTLMVSLGLENGQASEITVSVDAEKTPALTCKPDAQGVFSGELAVKGLTPGVHALIARAVTERNEAIAARTVVVGADRSVPQVRRLQRPAGFKAGPLRTGQGLVIADTAGQVTLVPARGAADPRKIIDVGMPILHTPALKDKTLFFGAADRKLYAVTLGGQKKWERELPSSAFGTPAMDDGYLYVGDLEGYAHAVSIESGEIKWSVRHATFAIEEPLLLHEGVIYFGAWDGQVYAVNAGDGSLKWKQGAPSGQNDPKKRNRYYGAADCGGVIIGQRLFFCDRGYMLGSYSLDGKYLGDIAGSVAAIGPTGDGQGFYARGLSKGLTRYDGEGKPVWSAAIDAGRFPAPPTEEAGKVYLCSNLGKLSVLDAADGKLLWEYQTTARMKVMAPVAHGCVLGMDGSVTRFGR